MRRQIPSPTGEINGRLWGARARDWADIQETQHLPVYHAVLDRLGIGKGTMFFDAGCGAGRAAQLASERGARVAGLDAAPNLLEIARHRVPLGEFRLGDLENLPWADATFDFSSGFNSFQFAGNPTAALTEAKRVTRRGGLVAVVAFSDPEGMDVVSMLTALQHLLPPLPPGAPGPFALSKGNALREFGEQAGLETVDVFDTDCPWQYPDLDTALRGFRSSGVAMRAIDRTSVAAVDEVHSEVLARFRNPDGTFTIGCSFRCLLARA